MEMPDQDVLPILTVRAWPPCGSERDHFEPDTAYAQFCWLPVLGPTAMYVYQRLRARAISVAGTGTVDMVELALSIGIEPDLGPDAPLWKALDHLDRMDLVAPIEHLHYVRPRMPPLLWQDKYDLPPTIRALERVLIQRRGQPTD